MKLTQVSPEWNEEQHNESLTDLDVSGIKLIGGLNLIDDLGGCVEAVLICDEVKAEWG